MNKLKLLDLFSGIGGFSYGLESTNGFETIAFCEKDKFCQKVLRKHWNNIKIYEDVRNIKGSEIKADVITGGFPCQPFSVAGKQRGTDDDRYLWDETLRVIAETKPKWFVGENVEGIVNIQEGKVLQQIQKDLEAESFQVQCVIIPASGIGAWHRRKRVWIIGCNVSNSNKSRSFKEYSSTIDRKNERNGFKYESGGGSNDVSNSESKRLSRSRTEQDCGNKNWLEQGKKEKQSEIWSKSERCSGISKDVSNSSIKRSQGYRFSSNLENKKQNTQNSTKRDIKEQQSWWQTQSELCGVPNGISYGLDKDRANRIKSLGNSIVPEIVKEIGLAILEVENEQTYRFLFKYY